MLKDIFNILQAIGLIILEKIIFLLGLNLSSFIFGTLMMLIGPFIPHSFIALKNLKMVFPDFSFAKRFFILIKMWNHLGRTFVEFLFFQNKPLKNIEKYFHMDEKSEENLLKIKNDKKGVFVFLAHFGQWNFIPQISWLYNLPFVVMYRKMNNKYANKVIKKYYNRTLFKMIEKKDNGTIKLINALKKNENILLLLDQRDKNGIEVPLFNIPSKTSTTLAKVAPKFDYKVYSIVIYRRHFYSVFFDIVIEEFNLEHFDNTNKNKIDPNIYFNTLKMNKKYEEWIIKRPEQWFWVHNRWKKIV
jgi:KDO2-lipid IV(A) lauroyltransferase